MQAPRLAGACLLAFSALSFSSFLGAQRAASAPDGRAKFEAAHPGSWTVWQGAHGVPYRVFGPGAELIAGGVKDVAQLPRAIEAFVEANGAWLGVSSMRELRPFHSVDLSNLWVRQYQQLHAGIPVRGGIVEFLVHRGDGKLMVFGSEAVPQLQIDPRPAFGKAAALAVYRARTGWSETKGFLHEQPSLEISADALGQYRLAWKITAELTNGTEGNTLWIDARNGAELDRESCVHNCALEPQGPAAGSLKGKVLGMSSPPQGGQASTNPPKALPMPGVYVNVPGIGSTYTDSNGDFSIPYSGTSKQSVTLNLSTGKWISPLEDLSSTAIQTLTAQLDPLQTTNFLFNKTPTQYLTAQVNGFRYATDVHDYLKRIVPGMTAIDKTMRVRVNYNKACNAYFSSAYGGLITFFRKAGSCNNTSSASVVTHEYGHGVDWRNGGIGSKPRTPSEGIADVHSLYYTDQPVIGPQFFTSGGGIRDGRNGLTHPLTGSTQRVHTFGQPYMGWAWDILVDARKNLGQVPGKKLCEKIIFASVAMNPRDMLDYILKAYVADDDDSNLNNGTPHIDILSKASEKRHFVRPVYRNIVITHKQIGDVLDGSSGFLIQAQMQSKIGLMSSADLYFDSGTGTFTKYAMKGSGSTWVAKTPGVAKGKLARYYLVARNNRGNVQRLPVENSDAFVIAVGNKAPIFKDDLEKGGSNFTPSNGSSTRGWLWSRPFGRNYDPAQAASGSYVYGVGQSSSEERMYRSGTWNLDSKPISTLGKKGTRLRFRRWATTDSKSSIRVYIGSQLVHSANRTNDQDWRTIDIDVSAYADNRSSVVLRFTCSNTNTDPTGGFTIDDVELYALAASTPGSFANYGKGCAGSNLKVAQLSAKPVQIGGTLTTSLANAKASSAAILWNGASSGAWGSIKLPLDLTAAGATGCSLLASGDFMLSTGTSTSGSASLGLKLPNDASLVGQTLYQQWIVVDALANKLGLAFSQGGASKIGG